ncbi:MAG: methyltransferase domain-containing protein [Candidatus Omnitrophica bacterium]|nr:methyltransferase domain-containing protein [Candidatus Omnitrophota bacterium]
MYKIQDAFLIAEKRLTQLKAMHISPDDMVIDVGSGTLPNLRANVLCDRYISDDAERDGAPFCAGRGQIIVACDARRLPFKNKAFDYSICSHLVEHVEDPALVLNELQRISKAGYIEMPNLEWETLVGRAWHYWTAEVKNGVLEITPKEKPVLNEKLSEWCCSLARESKFFYKELYMKPYKYKLMTAFEWKGSINYRINAAENFNLSWHKDKFKQEAMPVFAKQKMAARFHLLDNVYGPLIRRRSAKKLPPMHELTACPACRGTLEQNGIFKCIKCAKTYEVKKGIPFLII